MGRFNLDFSQRQITNSLCKTVPSEDLTFESQVVELPKVPHDLNLREGAKTV